MAKTLSPEQQAEIQRLVAEALHSNEPTSLVRDAEIRERLGISQMTLFRMRQRGQLPKPRKLNAQNVTPRAEFEAVLLKLVGAAHEC